MSRPLDSTNYSNSEDSHMDHTSPAVSVVVARNRAVCPCPWDTEVGVSVQRGLPVELGRVAGAVQPEVVVMAHTTIVVRARNKDMRVLIRVWRWTRMRAETAVLWVVRTIVVGDYRMLE
jgi:hypothetical protein